jgi:hypothetical protein
MQPDQVIDLSVEGALSILIFVIAYKIYKMKIKTHSGCCIKKDNGSGSGNGIIIDTQNSGVSNEQDILNKI